MRALGPALLLAALALPLPAAGVPAEAQAEAPEAAGPEGSGAGRSALHHVLLYLPNRVFDALDVVRARVRVGPGLALDARATRAVALFLGSYGTVYAGLPGPRGEARVPLPVGIETDAGIQAGLAKARTGDALGPGYGPAEIGVGVQAALVGIDLGVEPLELLDLVTGLVFVDLRGDDL